MSDTNGQTNNPNTDNKYLDMDLLRFTTAGSVDDGKSTLIGRLFYDSKSIFEDQMEAIEQSSKSSGEEDVNLALLTDGLKAEREQKITIDVAYRYFATPKRKFIIADTPGHTQYTRNMVTGASTADLAVILVDASKGLLTQSRRHAFISSLLRIPHLVVAVNKMDLVDYDEKVFNEIVSEFRAFAKKLNITDVTYIPISALKGDNVVSKSENTPWYNGSSLLHHLENVKVDADENVVDFRFPVQYVIRPHQNFRGFSGRIASGHIRPGDEIKVLPSGLTSKVKEVVTREGNLEIAYPGDSVTLTTEDEIDISRGDMIVRKDNVPTVRNNFEAYVCWMNEKPLEPGKQYVLQHTTRTTQVFAEEIVYRMNVDSLNREEAGSLELNEIGRVKLTTSQPLFFDAYQINKKTGSFIIIDPTTNVTVGAGMMRAGSTVSKEEETNNSELSTQHSPNVVWEDWNIPREEREKRHGHKAQLIWLTGISGAGKSTIARAAEQKLWEQGKQTMLLDGDQVRHGLNGDLGFSPADRTENIRRVGQLSRLFYEHGNIVLCTFVSPFAKDREAVKALFPEGAFKEVHITCAPETAQERDPKGLYKKAEEGEITGLTGFDAAHQAPEDPALTINTDEVSVEEAVKQILELIGQGEA
ncbi:sulfate adenylyltransferase subunit CysN [Gracilimonas mengyeensis]|uniref:Multifunctional fusion protein n=1 Tax=Gracilimonas mengyeensis TaxID=1302730 RepID=A0A521BZT3_9BACT|nr:sulfate adenylyltransferase subunit CysN [Gracilimonas mengyeensis]SMO52638.1 adenylylsulfate kinase /sulfate adenylyltransferase subunit 1 [Gracilimonas mengyeensis]